MSAEQDDTQRFANFSKDLGVLMQKYFGEDRVLAALAFAESPDYEVKFVMTTPLPSGIALLEQAADLARDELKLNLPHLNVNSEKTEELAEELIRDVPELLKIVDRKALKRAVVVRLQLEIEKTVNPKLSFERVHQYLKSLVNK